MIQHYDDYDGILSTCTRCCKWASTGDRVSYQHHDIPKAGVHSLFLFDWLIDEVTNLYLLSSNRDAAFTVNNANKVISKLQNPI